MVDGAILVELVLDRGGVLDVVLLNIVLVEVGLDGRPGAVLLCELGGVAATRAVLHDDAVHEGLQVAVDAQHHDIVVEVDRSEVELLPDLADLPVRETKSFLQPRTPIVLPNRVLVALAVVLYAYALEVPVLKDAVLHEVLPVEAADAFQGVVEVLPNADHSVLLQNEPVPLPLVETLLVAEEALISQVHCHRQVSRDLLLLAAGSRSLLHECKQKLLKRVHILGEMLGEYVVYFAVLDWLLADDLLEFVIDELADHDHVLLDHYCLAVEFVLAEHAIDCAFGSWLLALGAHPEDVVAVEFVVLHGAVGADVVGDVDVFAVDCVPSPLA